ncbi:hypothetical protein L596_015728 [Steinernema carpocapsae]|nr:hypothetical protein L596_015728 [Steinernema carpocapsae]
MVKAKEDCRTILTASYLHSKYKLAQFHAHWGHDGTYGSEHLIDGKPFSGEVHFVFWKMEYGSFDEATKYDDGLSVIAVFLQEGEYDNIAYEPIVDCVKTALITKGTVPVPHDFDFNSLLPKLHNFCTYPGSLTTPPYAECVVWTVIKTTVEVSKVQLDVFRQIAPSNVRACQEMCDRKVKASSME